MIAEDIENKNLEAIKGVLGDDPEDDDAAAALIAEELLTRSATFAETEDGAGVAAALLVSGAENLDNMADQAHPGGLPS
jgi:hypothetical protein